MLCRTAARAAMPLRRALLALAFAVPALAATAAERLPIFDAHMHYNREAWAATPPDEVLLAMAQAGVARALVSSTPDDGTLALVKVDARRFAPELRPYRGAVGAHNWHADSELAAFLEARLARTAYVGIGEVHLHDAGEVTAQVLAAADLAIDRDIPLHVHSGAGPVEALFRARPKLKILWAHAGMSTPAAEVGAAMDRHDALWAELSFRAEDIEPGGVFDDTWRAVLLRHAGRFMVGTDTYAAGRWPAYVSLIEAHRRWLAQLPAEVAERIAWRNAVALYGDGGLAAFGR